MNCHNILTRMGFDCFEVKPSVVGVNTPLTFADGEAVGFYVIEEAGDHILVTDNADTLAHLMGCGLPVGDRRRWTAIRNIAETYEFKLEDSGELISMAHASRLSSTVAKYLAMVTGITQWETELSVITNKEAALIDEIESHLRRRNPDIEISRSPSVIGATGRQYSFALQAGNVLIDAIAPDSRSTGAALRKFLDVERGASNARTLLVMDDRVDPERSGQEMMIISAVARAIPMTQLVTGKGPLEFLRAA